MFGFFKQLREAMRIVRLYEASGYEGPFAVLPEEVLNDLQRVYGRALCENKRYQEVLEKALDGLPVCEFCEDYQECQESGDCPKESFDCFMLSFPSNPEAEAAFQEAYDQCDHKCENCKGGCHL